MRRVVLSMFVTLDGFISVDAKAFESGTVLLSYGLRSTR